MDKFLQVMAVAFFVAVFTSSCASTDTKKDVISETLKPAGIHEDCFEGHPGDIFEYSFDASKPVNFNIHSHEGSGVVYTVQKDNTNREEGNFQPKKKEHYCLMWTNFQAEPLSLTYSLKARKR